MLDAQLASLVRRGKFYMLDLGEGQKFQSNFFLYKFPASYLQPKRVSECVDRSGLLFVTPKSLLSGFSLSPGLSPPESVWRGSRAEWCPEPLC